MIDGHESEYHCHVKYYDVIPSLLLILVWVSGGARRSGLYWKALSVFQPPLFVGAFPVFNTPFFLVDERRDEKWHLTCQKNRFPRGWAEKERGLRACSRAWRPCTRLHPTLWPGQSRQRSRSMACRARPIPPMISWARAALPRVKAPRRWLCSSVLVASPVMVISFCGGGSFLLLPVQCTRLLFFRRNCWLKVVVNMTRTREFGFYACGYHKRVVSHGLNDQVRPCLALIPSAMAVSSTSG